MMVSNVFSMGLRASSSGKLLEVALAASILHVSRAMSSRADLRVVANMVTDSSTIQADDARSYTGP